MAYSGKSGSNFLQAFGSSTPGETGATGQTGATGATGEPGGNTYDFGFITTAVAGTTIGTPPVYLPYQTVVQNTSTQISWLGGYSGNTYLNPMANASNYYTIISTGLYLVCSNTPYECTVADDNTSYIYATIRVNTVAATFYTQKVGVHPNNTLSFSAVYHFVAGNQILQEIGVVGTPIPVVVALNSSFTLTKIGNGYNQAVPPPTLMLTEEVIDNELKSDWLEVAPVVEEPTLADSLYSKIPPKVEEEPKKTKKKGSEFPTVKTMSARLRQAYLLEQAYLLNKVINNEEEANSDEDYVEEQLA